MPLARGEHQHDVGGLHADLPADVAAGERHHDGIGELAVGITHDHGTAAAPSAHHRGHLDHVGNHGDAIGACHEFFGNGIVVLREQFFEHAGSFDQSGFFTRARER